MLDSCEHPALLSRSARRNYSTSRLSCAKSRGTMSLTLAQRGSMALNQFRSFSGTPIVRSELFFRRIRENPYPLWSTLRFAVPIQAQVLRLSSVCHEIWQHGVSIHTVDKRDS